MSALEGRIRHLAREEAAAMLQTAPASTRGTQAAGGDVAELRAQLDALTNRVAELEKAAASPATKRTIRKTTAESTE